ncbi:unnamed protein product [Arabidopsis lyrata]|nr:unnamed protein product [Arabidopsis lyrata]
MMDSHTVGLDLGGGDIINRISGPPLLMFLHQPPSDRPCPPILEMHVKKQLHKLEVGEEDAGIPSP